MSRPLTVRRFASLGLLSAALAIGACGDGPVVDLVIAVSDCDSSLHVPSDTPELDAQCALDCLDELGCEDLEIKNESCVHECDVDVWGDEPKPTTSFGDDEGTLSMSAEELLSKPAANPDPETLVGVFELTGYGLEDHPEDFLIASNEWRARREHREDGIAMAIECLIDVGGATDDTQTLTAFAFSPIEVHDWGINILEASSDKQVYNQLGFMIECSVDIPQVEMPYCTTSGIPDGYSICVEVSQGHLKFRNIDGSELDGGKKISN
jgi:hypothetical protein